jgi:hypothetical protein
MDYNAEVEDDTWLESEIQKELDAVDLDDTAELVIDGEEEEPVSDVADLYDVIIGENLPVCDSE